MDGQADVTHIEDPRLREVRRSRELRYEKNALTIMPLPVRIPALLYDLLPKLLALIPAKPDVSQHYIPEEEVNGFLKMWAERLMRREGDHVWIRLGGVESYEAIPQFARKVEALLKARDAETKEQKGLMPLLQHWRTNVPSLAGLDDKATLEARKRMLQDFQPLTSTLTVSAAWGEAFERSRENMVKIRPVLQQWISQHGHEWNLEEPFGGKLSRTI